MKALNLLCLGFFFAAFILSCNKGDDSPQPEPTVEELLTSGMWYYESQSGYPLNDCDRKSNLRLLKNGNFVIEEYDDDSGTCERTEPYSGTWELHSDEVFALVTGTYILEYTIVSITDTKLVLQYSGGGSTPATFILDKNPGNG
ncbi:MAG: lipocalin family protein [Mangrovibacterium sp.]